MSSTGSDDRNNDEPLRPEHLGSDALGGSESDDPQDDTVFPRAEADDQQTEFTLAESALPEAQPRQPVLGDYVLLRRIGAGGGGRVFKAQHRRMERLVALKMLPPSAMRDSAAVARFHREVKAAAKLFHPNIVTAFDAGEQNGIHYLVMEYVDGQPLSQLVHQHGPLAPEKAADYITQAARGLEYAHGRELVHRDIKPSNLILDHDGILKILDLGTAQLDDGVVNELTQSGAIMGTVAYMSPEQARSSAQVDHRTDIYSLGCTLYYLLTGQPIYRGDLIQTLLAHAQEPIPSVRQGRPNVPEWLDQIFQRMVAKRPDQRYQTVGEVVEALGQHTAPRDQATQETGRLAGLTAGMGSDRGPSRRAPAVGIDLGTTYCRIAYVNDEGVPVTLLDGDGRPATPAAVYVDGMNVVVGQRAIKSLDHQSSHVALDVKRTVGQRLYPKKLGDSQYPPEALLALLLARVTEDAKRRIGDFRQVVISVPAWFDEVRRKAIQDAGFIAGLDVLDIINEPLAASLAHGFQHEFLKPPGKGDKPFRVVAIDLGGGALDVAVIGDNGDHLEELAIAGDAQLGGRDWDNRLVNLVCEQHLAKTGLDPRREGVFGRLWFQCEKAKRLLSTHDHVNIEVRLGDRVTSLAIHREELEDATSDLLARAEPVIQKALELANIGWHEVDRVQLAGGTSRTPSIQQLVKRLAARRIQIAHAPEDAVAHGAALYAESQLAAKGGGVPAFQIGTVNAHSLGVVGIDSKTGEKRNAVLIPRNSRLPAGTKRNFKTQKSGQDSLLVRIIQGENKSPDRCTQIGKCVIENLPEDLPAGSPVAVEFHYGANGRLAVYVESKSTGYRATKEIVRASGLNHVEVSRWREWIETIMLCSNFA